MRSAAVPLAGRSPRGRLHEGTASPFVRDGEALDPPELLLVVASPPDFDVLSDEDPLPRGTARSPPPPLLLPPPRRCDPPLLPPLPALPLPPRRCGSEYLGAFRSAAPNDGAAPLDEGAELTGPAEDEEPPDAADPLLLVFEPPPEGALRSTARSAAGAEPRSWVGRSRWPASTGALNSASPATAMPSLD